MSNQIDEHWRKIEAECGGFCCDAHRDEARVMFFTGAMAALNAMTGWDPENDPNSNFLCIDAGRIISVTQELTLLWHKKDEKNSAEAVRH
jgi:hypothetical protein